MSDPVKQKTPSSRDAGGETPDAGYMPETQGQRWVKYGSNVVLAVVLVIVIAGLLTYLVQRNDRRIDTTSSGVNSLKPQTKAVLDDLKDKVTIVSLYAHPPKQQTTNADGSVDTAAISDPAQTVADLLDAYKGAGKNVDVEVIDPTTEQNKIAKLHDQLVAQYGSQIEGYKSFLDAWDKTAKELSARMATQAADIKKIAGGDSSSFGSDEDDSQTVEVPGMSSDVIRFIKHAGKNLDDLQDALAQKRKAKYPDWKAITDQVKEYLATLSKNCDVIVQQFDKYKDNTNVAENVRAFMLQNAPKFAETKKQCDDLIASQGKLGELKIDQLEAALNVQNPILVLGPKDWRVLQYNQIWSADSDVRNMVAGKVRPRFAGEQQITSAIYSLTTTVKPKLCFIRPGGEPVTSAGFPPFIQAGPLSKIASRMREYNFDVTEKDLSGTWAMQAQMRRQPAAPEPSDEEIKDAIWVVLDMPRTFSAGQEQGVPPTPIAPKVKEHLDHGGSALIVFDYQAEDLKSALDSWGIDLHPEAMAMHEPLKLTEGSPTDVVEQAKAQPPLFVLDHYGDHPITKTVESLASVWFPTMVVRNHTVADATVTPLFSMDSAYPNMKVWGETDIEGMKPEAPPTFDKDKDLAAPIFGGAASEKKSGGRVVVMGAPILFNGYIDIPDPVIQQKQGRRVSLFPGNGELSANSIFWLAHLEQLIAISPEAMDVSRISSMSNGALNFWRYGVLLIILPIAVLVSGIFVYAGRRD